MNGPVKTADSPLGAGLEARLRPARRGFTILEIVLAVVIIGAACVPIVQSMLTSRTSLLASLEELSATSEATRTMEALKRLPFAELPVSIEDQPALDTAWDDQHFAWPPSAEGGPAQPRKTPAASLATLGPPVSKDDYRRSLAVSLVPVEFPGDTGPRAFKLVDVRISWKRPGATGNAEGSVALCTLLGPP